MRAGLDAAQHVDSVLAGSMAQSSFDAYMLPLAYWSVQRRTCAGAGSGGAANLRHRF